MRHSSWTDLLVIASLVVASACAQTSRPTSRPAAESAKPRAGEQVATFAGGCFWCMEPPFEKLPGVRAVVSGYSGGKEKNPTYKAVAGGKTGHTEAIQVVFDPARIGYAELVEVFWRNVDPTDAGGQFVDRGRQYRPEIFVHDAEQRAVAERSKKALAASGRFEREIVVPITDFEAFWPAEEYHQDFYVKSPRRYKSYRRGSGRDQLLARVWADEVAAREAAKAARYRKPSPAELREKLDPLQWKVTQEDGTERPFENRYWDNKRAGIYVDVVSGEPLFSSEHKFKSGTGWPSFYRPLIAEHIVQDTDYKLGYPRTEVRSKHGDSHLGHVFEDGPEPTGLRYCINSAALRFIPAADLVKEGYGEFADRFAAARDPEKAGEKDDPKPGKRTGKK